MKGSNRYGSVGEKLGGLDHKKSPMESPSERDLTKSGGKRSNGKLSRNSKTDNKVRTTVLDQDESGVRSGVLHQGSPFLR